MRFSKSAILCLFIFLPAVLLANSEYYRHTIFDNSLNTDWYVNSRGFANGSSYLESKDWRLPVETKTFLTPPDAIRIQWESKPNGGWEAEIHLDGFRNRMPGVVGHNLYFWVYSEQPVAAADMPQLVLSNSREGLQVAEFPGSFTDPLPLGKFSGDIP